MTQNLASECKYKYRLGQVGGFPLRLSWLPRLVIRGEKKPFSNHEAIAREMGIGMNMVRALRVWAGAAGIVDEKDVLTKRAKHLFSQREGVDKYAEKEETLWLLHWLICSNLDCFTANGWLLNFFHTRVFTLTEALSAFSSHLKNDLKRPYAQGTIRVDLETAIRMYAVVEDKKNKRGDIDDRCFCVMRLFLANRVGDEMRYVRVLRDEQPRLSSKIVMYSVIDTLSKRRTSSSSFSDLYAADDIPTPGMVFGLTKDGFLTVLEKARIYYPQKLVIEPMPDGDVQVRLKGKYAGMAEKGILKNVADNFYFSEEQQ